MKHIAAIVFSAAIVLAAYILGSSYVKRATPPGVISVTGSGSEDFTSDLIVWEGTFSQMNLELQTAFERLNEDKETVKEYLVSKGIEEDNFVFNSVQTIEQTEAQYQDGNYVGNIFKGYLLQQTVKIESKDVPKVEQVSREITELLQKGVQLNSTPPRYYYTKLSDLKIQMISAATEDARLRAEKIAENSGSDLGSLRSADLGVFQIIGQNSGEDFTWGGAYNTADKKKTASVTMRLEFEID
ncbi:SIMPL domain-containing protein [Salinimicrobium sediminilitoris]|uniref:SIMPL domain-containing protein n=1 Tax=Salinimicrobium sediminilitoris TaxID=2876715 RepID=UPI001E2CFFC5|nr:SIMPL domain-containing protein [Salinimicrobium sediminilitoris]MCC8360462.1 SIMPL domain-containing protein [Salinimicrobium sediminilitoris]